MYTSPNKESILIEQNSIYREWIFAYDPSERSLGLVSYLEFTIDSANTKKIIKEYIKVSGGDKRKIYQHSGSISREDVVIPDWVTTQALSDFINNLTIQA